jgi:hypothetical protein
MWMCVCVTMMMGKQFKLHDSLDDNRDNKPTHNIVNTMSNTKHGFSMVVSVYVCMYVYLFPVEVSLDTQKTGNLLVSSQTVFVFPYMTSFLAQWPFLSNLWCWFGSSDTWKGNRTMKDAVFCDMSSACEVKEWGRKEKGGWNLGKFEV